LPRKTDADNPADWIAIVESDLEGLHLLAGRQISYFMCRGKLAEVLEKILKAELIRSGWALVKTHDLRWLAGALLERDQSLAAQIKPLCEALAEAYYLDRYAGFDLDDPDWPDLRAKLAAVTALCAEVKRRIERGRGNPS